MADKTYQVDLHGAELSEALKQINEYLPEQWTTGTIKGVPVPVDNPRHENNAKYYAELAQSSIPEGTAGAVFFDRQQTLTEEQKAQARNNIGVGGSIPSDIQEQLDEIHEELDAKANVPGYVNYTILASLWEGNRYKALNSLYPARDHDLDIAISPNATKEEKDAYANAQMTGGPNSNVITALEIVPTIDIPVYVRVW